MRSSCVTTPGTSAQTSRRGVALFPLALAQLSAQIPGSGSWQPVRTTSNSGNEHLEFSRKWLPQTACVAKYTLGRRLKVGYEGSGGGGCRAAGRSGCHTELRAPMCRGEPTHLIVYRGPDDNGESQISALVGLQHVAPGGGRHA